MIITLPDSPHLKDIYPFDLVIHEMPIRSAFTSSLFSFQFMMQTPRPPKLLRTGIEPEKGAEVGE